MRRESLVRVFVVCAIFVVTHVRGQSVDFNSPGDLQSNFDIQPGTNGTFYSQVSTGGITGGAVDVFAISDITDTVVFKTSTPSPGESTIGTALFFRYDATLRDPTTYGFPLILGFSRTAINGVEAGVYLQTYNDTTNRMLPVIFGAQAETHAGPTATLISTHWYRLQVNLEPLSGTGRALLSMSLVDYGTSGQQPEIYFPAFSKEVPVFSGNTPTALFPAFRSFKSGGADLLDNFSVFTGGTLPSSSRLANISTRGRVANADETLIGGLIVQGDTTKRVIVRALGPSLIPHGVPGTVADPVLTLFDASGSQIAQNDNWRTSQEQEITDTHLAPTNDLEAAIVISLTPGNYTAVVSTKGAPGVGLVEVYDLE
ncbi:MAG: DVUA0089 family protein [Chthoniobacterales bacterium]